MKKTEKGNDEMELQALVFDLVKQGKIKTEKVQTKEEYERFINED